MRVISQPALLEWVVEEASRYPSFTFERGARVHDLIRNPAGRVVGVQLETEYGSREEWANLVVGRDGRGSLIRTRAQLELELLPENYDVLWYKLPVPEALREGYSIMIAVAARQHPAICYTSWDGRLQYGLVMPKGSLNAMRDKDWVRESVGSAPAWLAEHVLTNRDRIEGPVRLNVLVGRCPRLQSQEARGQGDARSGSWRFRLAKRGARLLGRHRWAQNAWLERQRDLRFGSTEVKLQVSP